MSCEIRISVRNLVEFLMRAGDLDDRRGAAPEAAMAEGARMHRRIQRSMGAEYAAEVSLKRSFPLPGKILEEDAFLALEGRADGIYEGHLEDDPEKEAAVTVDEIKTTYRPLRSIKEPEPVHRAQAVCYACIYAEDHDLEGMQVRMTYVNLDTEGTKYFYSYKTRQELREWMEALLKEYMRWAVLRLEWDRKRTVSIKALAFPYPYREGQRELAAGVYHTIAQGKKLFLEAPTGTGKTLAVLYPALKAVGEGLAGRIFYLTAKNVTAAVATDALDLLEEKGLALKRTVLTAKEKICILESPSCNPAACPRAAGHFDRVNEALYELLTGLDNMGREAVEACAEKYQVCPFELSLDATLFSDAVVCDYNYAFDPSARLRRFFADGEGHSYIFLIDEAHNLLERGREMYSADLRLSEVRAFRRAVRASFPTLWKLLGRVVAALGKMPDPGDGLCVLEEADLLSGACTEVYTQMQRILERERKNDRYGQPELSPELKTQFLDFYFDLDHFLSMYDNMDTDYVIYLEREKEGDAGKKDRHLKLYCVDPGRNLKACMDQGVSSILFSATFLPIQYYKSLLGGQAEDYEIYARSVFDPERRGLFIARDVTSRYKERGPETFRRIARCIHEIVSCRHGNYMIFFPSYAFLKEVAAVYLQAWPETEEVRCALQHESMDPAEREDFLRQFEEYHDDRSLLGFCVLGGVFSEGIDLREDRLIGVVVVGTGMPGVSGEQTILKDYFDRRDGAGFDYAYRFPGMNKVLQAAGRAIRTSSDVGIVALLDDRFLTGSYRRLFPAEWTRFEVVTTDTAGGRVSRFWDQWL